MAAIRDFIYLDIERVRSFYAQLTGSLPLEQTRGKESQVGAQGSVEGNVLIAKSSGNLDFRLHRLDSETSSLHDQIFQLFLGEIEKGNQLTVLPSPDFLWDESSFQDGKFILVNGAIKVLDYKHIASSIKNVMELGKLIDQINRKNSTKSTVVKDLKKSNVEEVQKFVENIIQDSLRLRIYPNVSMQDQVFVASAEEMFFRRNTSSLNHEYGPVIDANWKTLLQVNLGNHHSSPESSEEQNLGLGKIEAAMELVVGTLVNLTEEIQGVQFPGIAATPIAVYREISN